MARVWLLGWTTGAQHPSAALDAVLDPAFCEPTGFDLDGHGDPLRA